MLDKKHAFTLIELLIVVAIIAILAAIAVPNFLEAQTRAKISRVKNDFRALGVAIEAYAVDYTKYPPSYQIPGEWVGSMALDFSLSVITTPVSYITSVAMKDPFGLNTMGKSGTAGAPRGYALAMYFNLHQVISDNTYTKAYNMREYQASINDVIETHYGLPRLDRDHGAFMLWSCGPDRMQDGLWYSESSKPGSTATDYDLDIYGIKAIYDSTNGTISRGDMWRRGGAVLNNALPLN